LRRQILLCSLWRTTC